MRVSRGELSHEICACGTVVPGICGIFSPALAYTLTAVRVNLVGVSPCLATIVHFTYERNSSLLMFEADHLPDNGITGNKER